MSDRQKYFERARAWATDARARESRLLRVAWTVAGVVAAIAIFEAVALALLTPLKTVQPITLLVDRQTGYVQALDPVQPRRIGADAALTQAFLAQYVAAREGFDRATVSADYRRVALSSAGLARSQYLALMPATNPQSPLVRFPAGMVLVASVKSVSNLSEGVALVRFDTQRQDRSGRAEQSQPWISVVRYHYSDAPMPFADRLVNPLGFQVTSYRRDAEALPPAAANDPAISRPAQAIDSGPANALPSPPAIRSGQGATVYRRWPLDHIPLGSPLLSSRPLNQTRPDDR